MKYFQDTNWGGEGRVFCGVWSEVGGGGGNRMTKEHENLGKIPITSVISSPTTLYICNSPLQSPFPSISGVATATRRKTNIWLCPSGHFYNAGWDALENPISSPTAIWPQVVISNNVCFHWFLWTQTKAATTFFFFLPNLSNCSCCVGLFVSKATAYI